MVEFKKIEPDKPKSDGRTAPLSLATKAQAEERLFHFLRSLRDGRPQAAQSLALDADTLARLYADPGSDLVAALRHCLDAGLVEFGPDAAAWGELALAPAVWGVSLAAHNCLAPGPSPDGSDPILDFTAALIETLPPARRLPEALAYHALLNRPAEALPHLVNGRAGLLHRLLNRSPLTALAHLHRHTPPALTPLAAELLPGWRGRAVDPDPWAGPKDWFSPALALLDQPALALYLRRRWLALPENRSACRNLGLFLETLRRRGDRRAFILEFYEAYEYFRAETGRDERGRPGRRWPLLAHIERLLRAGHDIDPGNEAAMTAALQINRRGNEYFLKFRPLIRLIVEEGGPPVDYNHLRDLPLALRPLLDLVTDPAGQRFDMTSIQFEGEEER